MVTISLVWMGIMGRKHKKKKINTLLFKSNFIVIFSFITEKGRSFIKVLCRMPKKDRYSTRIETIVVLRAKAKKGACGHSIVWREASLESMTGLPNSKITKYCSVDFFQNRELHV